MQERSEAERRAIWPCLNVATWPTTTDVTTTNMLTSTNQVPYILAVTALNASKLNSAV